MKLLLYCCKAKPYIMKYEDGKYKEIASFHNKQDLATYDLLNGKIVAECDFEVEKIRKGWGCLNGTRYFRNNVNHYYPDYELEKQSCLSFDEIDKYLKGKNGYAIHIKNLKIFDEPRELSEYYSIIDMGGGMLGTKPLAKAPQNMMRVSINQWEYCFYNPDDINILISIQPQWLCKILNKEKTIEIRKKVLKEMK